MDNRNILSGIYAVDQHCSIYFAIRVSSGEAAIETLVTNKLRITKIEYFFQII